MKNLAAILTVCAQLLSQTGTVSGFIRSSDGTAVSGVRVYAIAASETAAEQNPVSVIEGFAQTDLSGSYRLDLPPGRYYIATGSLGLPTYYPGTSDIADALVVTVPAGRVADRVDFPAGVLAGSVRFTDGRPAHGLIVSAIPSALATLPPGSEVFAPTGGLNGQKNSPGVTMYVRLISLLPSSAAGTSGAKDSFNMEILQTITDSSGRYAFTGVPAGNYYIVAGFEDFAVFYPGTGDISAAQAVPITPAGSRRDLDLEFPVIPSGVTVSGRITARSGLSAAGMSVSLRSRNPVSATFHGLPFRSDPREARIVRAGEDGRYEFANVSPGLYTVSVQWPGHPTAQKNVTVRAEDIGNADLEIPYALFWGRVLWEDGTPFWAPEIFGAAILTKADGSSTTVKLPPAGPFSTAIAPGEYRVSLATIPDDYVITFITADGANLLDQTFRFTGTEAVAAEIRVAKKSVR